MLSNLNKIFKTNYSHTDVASQALRGTAVATIIADDVRNWLKERNRFSIREMGTRLVKLQMKLQLDPWYRERCMRSMESVISPEWLTQLDALYMYSQAKTFEEFITEDRVFFEAEIKVLIDSLDYWWSKHTKLEEVEWLKQPALEYKTERLLPLIKCDIRHSKQFSKLTSISQRVVTQFLIEAIQARIGMNPEETAKHHRRFDLHEVQTTVATPSLALQLVQTNYLMEGFFLGAGASYLIVKKQIKGTFRLDKLLTREEVEMIYSLPHTKFEKIYSVAVSRENSIIEKGEVIDMRAMSVIEKTSFGEILKAIGQSQFKQSFFVFLGVVKVSALVATIADRFDPQGNLMYCFKMMDEMFKISGAANALKDMIERLLFEIIPAIWYGDAKYIKPELFSVRLEVMKMAIQATQRMDALAMVEVIHEWGQVVVLPDADVLYDFHDTLKDMKKFVSSQTNSYLTGLTSTLLQQLIECESVMATHLRYGVDRFIPFCIAEYGAAGTGKSTRAQAYQAAVGKILKLRLVNRDGKLGYDQIAVISDSCKFDENIYNTTDTIMFDDMGIVAPEFGETGASDLASRFMQCQSSVPFTLNKANLEEKKGSFWSNKLTLCTSNDHNFGMLKKVTCQDAWKRRMHVIVAVNRNADGSIYWNVSALKFGTIFREPEVKCTTEKALLDLIRETARKYVEHREECLRNKITFTVCKECHETTYHCTCNKEVVQVKPKKLEEKKDTETDVIKVEDICPECREPENLCQCKVHEISAIPSPLILERQTAMFITRERACPSCSCAESKCTCINDAASDNSSHSGLWIPSSMVPDTNLFKVLGVMVMEDAVAYGLFQLLISISWLFALICVAIFREAVEVSLGKPFCVLRFVVIGVSMIAYPWSLVVHVAWNSDLIVEKAQLLVADIIDPSIKTFLHAGKLLAIVETQRSIDQLKNSFTPRWYKNFRLERVKKMIIPDYPKEVMVKVSAVLGTAMIAAMLVKYFNDDSEVKEEVKFIHTALGEAPKDEDIIATAKLQDMIGGTVEATHDGLATGNAWKTDPAGMVYVKGSKHLNRASTRDITLRVYKYGPNNEPEYVSTASGFLRENTLWTVAHAFAMEEKVGMIQYYLNSNDKQIFTVSFNLALPVVEIGSDYVKIPVNAQVKDIPLIYEYKPHKEDLFVVQGKENIKLINHTLHNGFTVLILDIEATKGMSGSQVVLHKHSGEDVQNKIVAILMGRAFGEYEGKAVALTFSHKKFGLTSSSSEWFTLCASYRDFTDYSYCSAPDDQIEIAMHQICEDNRLLAKYGSKINTFEAKTYWSQSFPGMSQELCATYMWHQLPFLIFFCCFIAPLWEEAFKRPHFIMAVLLAFGEWWNRDEDIKWTPLVFFPLVMHFVAWKMPHYWQAVVIHGLFNFVVTFLTVWSCRDGNGPAEEGVREVGGPIMLCANIFLDMEYDFLPSLLTAASVTSAFAYWGAKINPDIGLRSLLRHLRRTEDNQIINNIGEYVGSLLISQPFSKSKCHQTQFYEITKCWHPEVTAYTIPDMRATVDNGVYRNSILACYRQMNSCGYIQDESPFWTATCMLTKHMEEKLGDDLQNWEPYDLKSAIVGDYYTTSLNRKAAKGFPYSGIKDDWFSGTHEQPVMSKELVDEITRLIENMDTKNEPPLNISKASLKDEVISKEKNAKGQVRVFFAGNTPFLMLCRIYLGKLMNIFMRHRKTLFPKIGMNAIGPEFHEMAYDMFKQIYGDDPEAFKALKCWIDGDFSKYDKLLLVLKYAIHSIWWLARKVKYFRENEKQLNRLRLILISLQEYIVIIGEDVFIMRDKLPSGVWATALINCICEALLEILMFYFLYYLFKFPQQDLIQCDFVGRFSSEIDVFKEMALSNYGDDNFKCLSPIAVPLYTHDNIMKFSKFIHMGITPARKHELSIDVKPITEVLFLKRVYTWCEHLGRFVGKLDRSSIAKMLAFTDKVETPEWKRAVIDTARREMSFHGKTEYDTFCKLFNLTQTYEQTLEEVEGGKWTWTGAQEDDPIHILFELLDEQQPGLVQNNMAN